jgi:hypothetical protein
LTPIKVGDKEVEKAKNSEKEKEKEKVTAG